ncbi:unnamed protein product [Absidia cylindrospora]
MVEDMKHLGFQLGYKEKLLVMRLLGMNGKLKEMEKVFEDFGGGSGDSKEHLLLALDPTGNISDMTTQGSRHKNNNKTGGEAQKPYNIILNSYQEYASMVGTKVVAQKSMHYYGEMLDLGIRPSIAVTRVLMENIRLGGSTGDTTELVWDWFWNKIGMNVGGKTRDLEPLLYKEMVMYFTGVGRPEYALEVNDIMTKKNMPKDQRMMNALIHKVGRAGDIDKSLALLNDMMITEGMVPNHITFNALIDIHTHKKPKPDFAGASRMYKMMQEIGLQPDIYTYGTLIDMFGKEGDLTMVRQLFLDMKSRQITPSHHIYSSLLECFINNDDQQSALDVMRIIRHGDKNNKSSSKRIQPNIVMHNILIKSYAKKCDLRRALVLVDLIHEAGLPMDAQTFTPILSHYAGFGDVDGAHMVMNKMEKLGIEGTPHTYTSLLHAYSKAGDLEATEQLFDDYKRRWRPNGYAFNPLLYVYIKENKPEKVFATYQKMLKTSIKMTEHTYGILMYFYSQRREIRAVEALMNTMQANDIKPGPICWSVLMQSYFRTGRSADARQVMEQMVQDGAEPTWVTWTTLIKGLVNDGELDLAESVLQKTLDRHGKQHDARLREIQQHFGDQAALANVNTRTGNRSLAYDIDVYTQQLPTTIEDLLDQQQSDLHQLPRTIPPGHIFTSLIRGYTNAGQFDKAREIFNTLQHWKVPINQVIYSTLMKLYLREERYDVVETIWTALRNHYKSPSAPSKTPQVYVDGLGDIPLPKYNRYSEDSNDDEDDEKLLLAISDDTNMTTADQPIGKDHEQQSLSPFMLSTYLDSLLEQDRYDDIRTLWTTLEQEGYEFDEQNWNRYTVSLVNNGALTEACTVAYRHILEADEETTQRHTRPGDKTQYFLESGESQHYLHHRTCRAFAQAFDIPGHMNMGAARLRTLVLERINYLAKGEKATVAPSTSMNTIID